MSTFEPQHPRILTALAAIQRTHKKTPTVGLVLGSGLGAYADTLANKVVIPFGEVPGMAKSNVVGHAGNFVFGDVGSLHVVAMQGRVHLYEGHPVSDVVFGARLMTKLGAKSLLITNAAGGCGKGLEAGDLMLIDDHLNLTGENPLVGANEPELGVRFPDMTRAYDPALGSYAVHVATKLGFALKRGVYAGLLGPTYETPAEVRMLRALGADAVGMSTVLETIAARHMGARVLGFSCITNLAAGMTGETLSHDEVTETAERVKGRFTSLLHGVLTGIATGEVT